MSLGFWWPYLRANKRQWVFALFLATLCIVFGIALLGTSGWFLALTFVLMQNTNLFIPSAMVRAFSFLRILSRYGEKLAGHQLSLGLQARLRGQLFRAMSSLPASQLHSYKQVDLSHRLMSDVEQAEQLVLSVWSPLIAALVMVFLYICVLTYAVPTGFVVWLGMGIIILVIMPFVLGTLSLRQGSRRQGLLRDFRVFVSATKQARLDILGFHQRPLVMQQLGHWQQQYQAQIAPYERIRMTLLTFSQVLIWASVGACIYFFATAQFVTLSPPLRVGLVVALLGFGEILIPWFRGASKVGQVGWSIKQITQIFMRARQSSGPGEFKGTNISESSRLVAPNTSILEISGLEFSYSSSLHSEQGLGGETKGFLLRVSDLRIEAARPVLIQGASGSGKSTLLACIAGVLTIKSGQISLGTQILASHTIAQWSRQVAWFSHDAPVFMMTLRDNLLLAKPDAEEAMLWEILEQVGLYDEVQKRPLQLDEWVGETGWRLSVGQARRLALARILLSDAQVLLLDEPTASLDYNTENLVWQTLAKLSEKKVMIVVSHASPERRRAISFSKTYRIQAGELRLV